jgi:NAD(P) transhydrogenase
VKLLFRREDMMLMGVRAIGEQATELVHIGMVAMLTNSTARLFLALDAILPPRFGRNGVC